MSTPAFDPSRAPERLRELVTPEGVPLRLPVALAGDRIAALLFDLLIIAATVGVVVVPLMVLAVRRRIPGDLVGAVAVLLVFLVRTFYFAFFELSWQGQTPGKRRLRIRVVDARGGPLTAEAIIARNLTREVEIFLPIVALAGAEALFPGSPVWARLGALGWMLAFGLLPLFNRDRMRVGDLVAGTVVVRTPLVLLLEELAARAAAQPAPAFSAAQLDVYGVYELQVLEQVLRETDAPRHAQAVAAVAEKIRQKIGWAGPPTAEPERFLRDFYAALRARLEHRMLLGRRRASKHDRV